MGITKEIRSSTKRFKQDASKDRKRGQEEIDKAIGGVKKLSNTNKGEIFKNSVNATSIETSIDHVIFKYKLY